ncbi:Aldo-keto reductase str7 [Paramyrothecium foliicola]|nr:Aldo-keto reductase str7 [Paramyrothecium foliicola]
MTAPITLKTGQLGSNGPRIPRIGLGAMGLSGIYGVPGPDEERLAFSMRPTNEVRPSGTLVSDEYNDSEDLIRKWLAANPDKRKDIGIRIESSPEYARQAIERSLKRLGTMEALVELKQASKILHIGLSDCSAASLRRAHAVHPIAAAQVEYSAFCTAIETPQVRLLETARKLGVAIVAYAPLGHGLLTGALRRQADFAKEGDLRASLQWLHKGNLAINVAVVEELTKLAETKGAPPAQLALVWLLAQGPRASSAWGRTWRAWVWTSLRRMRRVRELAKGVRGGRVQVLTGYSFADTPELR